MKIKLFEEFIGESRKNPLVDSILSALENTILEMVNRVEKFYTEKEVKFTEYDRELVRLNIIYDMLRSVESYTLPTDVLISINPSTSRKGNIEIFAQIQRAGEDYTLSTEAIIAGGYNIQRAHYRYLTKTNLPKTGQSAEAQAYAAEIKKLTKVEKLNQEISYFERDIEKIDANLPKNSSLTDEQIAQILKDESHYSHNNPSWEQIIKNGAAKNYDNSEEVYNAAVAKYQASGIDFWKTQNVKWPTDRKKSLQKEISKLRAKVEAAINATI
jgi:hypothetical protein